MIWQIDYRLKINRLQNQVLFRDQGSGFRGQMNGVISSILRAAKPRVIEAVTPAIGTTTINKEIPACAGMTRRQRNARKPNHTR